jgi:hypothetical protein
MRVATVLDVDGWIQVRHQPKRCRRRPELCTSSGKRIFYNYIAMGKGEHVWTWPAGQPMEFFFLYCDWGVSCKWLRQHTLRMAFQWAAFSSEAHVHEVGSARNGANGRLPCRADLKIKQAWYMWRVVVRLTQSFQLLPAHI